ncbi:MAG: DUF3179 domain-containing protein [Alphaproteobacteria bacterium]|nr:DUF3179 domain-containing protein [Alphaproteobacteria bacterium]
MRGCLRSLMAALLLVLWAGAAAAQSAPPGDWVADWPRTDFAKRAVDFDDVLSGGPPKDGIPAIDSPIFRPVVEVDDVAEMEPVIAVTVNGEQRAYPLQVLIWHEIVNDVVGGVPVAVTYGPLCNAAVVYDRRVGGRVLSFGTTGKLRHADLVMYDRETESWWQQFTGEAIVGTLLGAKLSVLPSRLESFVRFRARGEAGKVLEPGDPVLRPYGMNPYRGYDSQPAPVLYRGALPAGIAPLARVVRVGREAWALSLLQKRGQIRSGDLVLSWTAGQSSALDEEVIADGTDVGNVVVQRRTPQGLVDVAYGVDFAFAFHAFFPDGPIHGE